MSIKTKPCSKCTRQYEMLDTCDFRDCLYKDDEGYWRCDRYVVKFEGEPHGR